MKIYVLLSLIGLILSLSQRPIRRATKPAAAVPSDSLPA
jgi:hypothetical protein